VEGGGALERIDLCARFSDIEHAPAQDLDQVEALGEQ
jgi:hypothetical protein